MVVEYRRLRILPVLGDLLLDRGHARLLRRRHLGLKQNQTSEFSVPRKENRKMASVLFSPLTLRGLTLPNRVVVSPMCQYNSNNGSANEWHLMWLGHMFLGGAGVGFWGRNH